MGVLVVQPKACHQMAGEYGCKALGIKKITPGVRADIKNDFATGAGNDFMDMFPNLVKAIFS